MSEDCHDSNIGNPFAVTPGDMAPQWIQPVAENCPLDGHDHLPGQFCRGCHDLTGWMPPGSTEFSASDIAWLKSIEVSSE
jgi:hypothetical protein